MLKEILAYQEIDAKLIELERSLTNSEEFKKAQQAQVYLKQVEESLIKMEKQASELVSFYDKAKKAFDTLNHRLQELDASKLNDAEAAKRYDALVGEIVKIEKNITTLSEQINKSAHQYSDIAKKSSDAKKILLENRRLIEVKKQAIAESVIALQTQLKEAAHSVDKRVLEKYLVLRKENKSPVIVTLQDKKRCGGCRTELSLSTLGALRDKGSHAECEHCKRIIYNG